MVLGTRPGIVKFAPTLHRLRATEVPHFVVHSGLVLVGGDANRNLAGALTGRTPFCLPDVVPSARTVELTLDLMERGA